MSATHSPNADAADQLTIATRVSRRIAGLRRRVRAFVPRTFQARLTLAFVAVLTLTLVLVTLLVINRLDDYFTRQQESDLGIRSSTVNVYVQVLADSEAIGPVVGSNGVLDPAVAVAMSRSGTQRFIADQLGRADVVVRFGRLVVIGETVTFAPVLGGQFEVPLLATSPGGPAGQTRQLDTSVTEVYGGGGVFSRYAIEVTLANPYTFRATALANVTGLLAAIALFALGLSVVVAAGLARRFTTPLRRLTEASRALAEGDLARRIPSTHVRAGSAELAELALQFNAMADRVEEGVELIRSDRDRSRDFLADVSHELRTPIAALRMFNELLVGSAGSDPDARSEFLESGGQQLERLDWLAQNLLELSKLDSGLVLMDLRPDDLRVAIESSVDQAHAAAQKRGVTLELTMADRPIRIRHDPLRIGQVATNLVANAVKFTPRGGTVVVEVAATDDGARLDVVDTGVGIDPAEMPKIFDRFYRGAQASEARGSGSGLGLAIVRSIVEMHGGRIEVESHLGRGSRFSVRLPTDPRLIEGTPAAQRAAVASAAEGSERAAAPIAGTSAPQADLVPKVAETSSSEAPRVNPEPAP